jgi:hypothetical protein
MSARTRKLIASLFLLIFSACFFTFVIAVAAGILPGRPLYAHLLYYFLVSVIWMLPVGWMIRWAQRPGGP